MCRVIQYDKKKPGFPGLFLFCRFLLVFYFFVMPPLGFNTRQSGHPGESRP